MIDITATEVRCQEKTRGGLCYEVILGEPEVKATPPKRTISPQNKNMSVQDIEEKLRAAEERRQVNVQILFICLYDIFLILATGIEQNCRPFRENVENRRSFP